MKMKGLVIAILDILPFFQVTPFSVYNIFLPRHAMVIELNHEGQIVGSESYPGAIKIGAASEAFEYNAIIYIGHFESPGERGGSVVECRTPEREVRGSRPTAAVLCP